VPFEKRGRGYWLSDQAKVAIGKAIDQCPRCLMNHQDASAIRFGVPPDYPEEGGRIWRAWCGVNDQEVPSACGVGGLAFPPSHTSKPRADKEPDRGRCHDVWEPISAIEASYLAAGAFCWACYWVALAWRTRNAFRAPTLLRKSPAGYGEASHNVDYGVLGSRLATLKFI
jgi:hypothetical protein